MSDSPVPSVSLDRRRFLAALAALAALPVMNAAALPLFAEPRPFSLDILRERAKQLAAKPFQAPRKSASQALRDLNQQQYHDIRYRPQDALWQGETPFTAQFFHPGFYYQYAVRVFDVTEGKAVNCATRQTFLILVATNSPRTRSTKPTALQAFVCTMRSTARTTLMS